MASITILGAVVVLLSITKHSGVNTTYCICKDGLSDEVYQKDIDYACGAGAHCEPIRESGPCFQPKAIRSHCNYAVNSYYQSKKHIPGSCNFSNTATIAQAAPQAISECGFPRSPRSSNQPPQQHRGAKFHLSLSVKIPIASSAIILVIVVVRLLLLHLRRRALPNGAQVHQQEAANPQADLGGIEVGIHHEADLRGIDEIVVDPALLVNE